MLLESKITATTIQDHTVAVVKAKVILKFTNGSTSQINFLNYRINKLIDIKSG